MPHKKSSFLMFFKLIFHFALFCSAFSAFISSSLLWHLLFELRAYCLNSKLSAQRQIEPSTFTMGPMNLSVLSKNMIEPNHFENLLCFHNDNIINNVSHNSLNFHWKKIISLLFGEFRKYATSEAHRLQVFGTQLREKTTK